MNFYFCFVHFSDAAGNFLAPITGLSFNAYRTVLEIDTMGTFFMSKVVYEKTMQVSLSFGNGFSKYFKTPKNGVNLAY